MATQNITVSLNGNASGLMTALNASTNSFKMFGAAVKAATIPLRTLAASGKNAFSILNAMGRTGTSVLSGLGSTLGRVNGFFSNHSKVLQTSATYYKGLVGQVVSLNRFINVLGSSIRQIGQGLQNFGIVFSLYISAPISKFIYDMTKGMLDFQDALIEVRRTTGLSNVELGKLADHIQQIALQTPTSRLELADMAAAWGRLGITGTDSIAKLVEESDKLRIATTLTADQVVDDLGKIGAIYFESSADFAEQYNNIASAINELGQASAVDESEIVAAFLRVAPVGAQLGISLPDLLGVATTAAERAASPERAGTQLARALTEQASKVQAFAEVLGITTDEVRALIDTNAVEFFLNVAEAIGEIESASKRVAIGEELFGGVGSKAVNALAVNLPGLYENLVLSNTAFDEGTSIQREYERSLDSVKVQLGILRNNFEYLGSTIGEMILPYLSKFATAAIPAIQAATEAFDGLNERVKITVVAFGAFLAVLGPILLFVGSLLFSIGIITTGFTALFTQVVGVGVGLSKFLFTILSLLAPISLLRIAILGIGATLLYVYNISGEATNRFAELVTNAYKWGASLIEAYAGGILTGVGIIQNAMLTVINSFIGLIQAFSPPMYGPLNKIDLWGKGLMGAYADGIDDGSGFVETAIRNATEKAAKTPAGFVNAINGAVKTGKVIGDAITTGIEEGVSKLPEVVKEAGDSAAKALDETADYIITVGAKFSSGFAEAIRGLGASGTSGFQDIFSAVRGLIEAGGSNLGLDREIIDQNVLDGAQSVLDMINKLESGGSVGGSLSSIGSLLNGLAGDIESMAEAQYKYNAATEELDRIKKDSEDLSDALRQEIAMISARDDLTLDQKSALIRAARLRQSDRKSQLDEEKKAAEDRVDTLKDELDRKRGVLDILRDLIFPADKEKIKNDAEDFSNSLAEGFDPDAYTSGLQEANEKLAKLFDDSEEKLNTFFDKVNRAKEIWRGFIAGLTGDFDLAQLDREGATFWEGFIPGNNIRVAWTEITGVFTGMKEAIDDTILSLKNLGTILGGGALTGYLKLDPQTLEDWNTLEQIVYRIGFFFGELSASLTDFYTQIEPQRKNMANAFKNADQAGKDSNNYAAGFIQGLDFGELGKNVAEIINIAVGQYLNPGSEAFNTLSDTVASFFGGVIEFIITFFGTADLSGLGQGLMGIINTAIKAISPDNLDPGAIERGVKNVVQAVIDFLAAFDINGGTEINLLSNLVNSILKGLAAVDLAQFQTTLQRTVGSIIWGLANVNWGAFFEIFNNIASAIITTLSDPMLWEGVVVLVGNIIDAMIEAFPQFHETLTDAVSDLLTGIVPAILKSLRDAFMNALFGTKESFQNSSGNIWQWTADQMQNPQQGSFPILDYFAPTDYSNNANSNGQDPLAAVPVTSNGDKANSFWDWLPWNKKDANDAGQELGREVTTGVGEYVTGSEASNRSMTDIDTYASNVETKSAPAAYDLGTSLATMVIGGTSDVYASDSTQTEFNTLLTALTYWGSTNSLALNKIGSNYGAGIVTGIITEIGNADNYMSWLLSGSQDWLNNGANRDKVLDVGYNWGVLLVQGLTEAVVASQDYIWSAIDKVLQKNPLPLDPSLIPPSPYNPVRVSSVDVMDVDKPDGRVASVGDIYITVNSTQSITEAETRRLSQRIQDDFRKQSRIKGK